LEYPALIEFASAGMPPDKQYERKSGIKITRRIGIFTKVG